MGRGDIVDIGLTTLMNFMSASLRVVINLPRQDKSRVIPLVCKLHAFTALIHSAENSSSTTVKRYEARR